MSVDSHSKSFTKDELCASLRTLGLPIGACTLCHSSLLEFGIPELKGENLCHFYLDAFFKVTGEQGIFVLPAFSYSFCKKQDFDPLHTHSSVNSMSNYCIDHGLGVRTIDPIFSYIFVTLHDLRRYEHLNPHAKDHFSALDDAPLANPLIAPENSPYNQLRQLEFSNEPLAFYGKSIVSFLQERNAYYLMLGKIYHISLLHNIETKIQSPYRFYKPFTGKIVGKAVAENYAQGMDFTCNYMVRVFIDNTIINFPKMTNTILSWRSLPHFKDAFKDMDLGKSHISVAPLHIMLEQIEAQFKQDLLWPCNGPELSTEEIEALEAQENTRVTTIQTQDYPVIDLNRYY